MTLSYNRAQDRGKVDLTYIMRNFCLRKNLKSPETMEVKR